MNNYIIGAGFSGLAAGYKTGYQIFETSEHAGGICRTYIKDGFEFDVGGPHWLFGNNTAIDFVRTLVELKTYDRNAGVYFNKTFPYPFQVEANKEFEGVGEIHKSFRSWLGQNFGRPMCNLFFFPFNEKYTAGLMDEIIPFDSYKTPTSGTGWVSQFHDPVGGLNVLVEKMARECHITFKKAIVVVNYIKKTIKLSDGQEIKYNRLISTIPLDQMLKLCGRQDYDLPYSSVFVLNIGAEKALNTPKEHWLYIPFSNTNFHRLGFYTNVDPAKAPAGKAGLSVEIAFRDIEYEDLDIDYITHHVVRELQSWGFIGKVITVDPTWVKCAYTWNRTLEERERHIKWLKDRSIESIGRYGKWKFQGLAESIMDGLEIK